MLYKLRSWSPSQPIFLRAFLQRTGSNEVVQCTNIVLTLLMSCLIIYLIICIEFEDYVITYMIIVCLLFVPFYPHLNLLHTKMRNLQQQQNSLNCPNRGNIVDKCVDALRSGSY